MDRDAIMILEYRTAASKVPYREWLTTLDVVTKARIQARVFRFELGHLGDTKSVGDGVFEARVDFGSGYRVYFGRSGRSLIVLLLGGDKRSQQRDIAKAKSHWTEWKVENAKKKS